MGRVGVYYTIPQSEWQPRGRGDNHEALVHTIASQQQTIDSLSAQLAALQAFSFVTMLAIMRAVEKN